MKSIAKERDDIKYLGADAADMKIGKLKIRLYHGVGGLAYAKSYKLQKYLDAIPIEERPDILQTGHIHQSFYMKLHYSIDEYELQDSLDSYRHSVCKTNFLLKS